MFGVIIMNITAYFEGKNYNLMHILMKIINKYILNLKKIINNLVLCYIYNIRDILYYNIINVSRNTSTFLKII